LQGKEGESTLPHEKKGKRISHIPDQKKLAKKRRKGKSVDFLNTSKRHSLISQGKEILADSP